jgi:ectoine hydroxylase-related dioxygenase (phytanoyl-CoA dioxygenase family)
VSVNEAGPIAVRSITDEEASTFRQNGWVKLEGLIDPEVAAETLAHVQERMGTTSETERTSLDNILGSEELRARWRDWENPSREDDYIRALVQSEGIGRAASRLLDDRPVRYFGDNVMVKMPVSAKGSNTPWHQDFPYFPFDRSQSLTIWLALVDCSPEKGTLRFYSGSHREGLMGRVAHRTDGRDLLDLRPDIVDRYELSPPLHLKAGDATVHHHLTAHAAPENSTETPRWIMTLLYMDADMLFTGASQRRTDGLGLTINEGFEHANFPRVA